MKKKTNGIDEIVEATQELQQDTDEILEDTSAIDKKTSLLIWLWIVDKLWQVVLIGLGLWLGKTFL